MGLIIFLASCTFSPIPPPPQSSSKMEPNRPESSQKAHHTNSFENKTDSEKKASLEGSARAKPDIRYLRDAAQQPLSPEQTSELLDEVGANWLYGQGMGETAVTIGTIAAFPPFAIWVLGNAALQISGEEPIEVADLLPQESGDVWRTTYSEITSVPGRTSAAVAREDYRTQEVARERIEAVLEKSKVEQRALKARR